MAPRRRIPAAQRRALIAERAAEVFAECGYDGASIDEIARRSGVSAPVLHDHFPSKLALYRQVLDTEYARLREAWRHSISGQGPMKRRVAAAFDAWFAHVEQRQNAIPVLFQVFTADPDARQAQIDATTASRSMLVPLIDEVLGTSAKGDGDNAEDEDEDEDEMLLEIIAASLRALALWWHSHPATPRARLVAAAMDALWPGLRRRPSRSIS